MALFDAFKKKECCICGKEVGLLGNRKLQDGNMCSKCAAKLSPWFSDRRESTVQQIKEQLAYREENARQLQNFQVSRIIGEEDKMFVEEINGVPTRFFICKWKDYLEENPDIISFRDIRRCEVDINEVTDEIKRQNKEGNYVSYNPPRYRTYYDFYMKMEIGNSPYFDDIRFQLNDSSVTLETVQNLGGALLNGLLGNGVNGNLSTQSMNPNNLREQNRYDQYKAMCKEIQDVVAAGRAPRTQAAPVQAAAPQAGPKFCPGCGARTTGSRFCPECGTKLY